MRSLLFPAPVLLPRPTVELVRERVGEDVARRDLHGLLEEIMLEDNEAGVHRCRIVEDGLPVGQNLASACGSAVEIEVCESLISTW